MKHAIGFQVVTRILTVVWIAVVTLPATAQTDQTRGRQTMSPGQGGRSISVEVVRPKRRTVVRELRMPATLRADEQVDLFAKTSGYVARIDLDIGDRVKKGDVLVEIDVPEMADELRQAEAILHAKETRVTAARAKTTQAQRLLDTARAQVRESAARHELDEINLQRKQELQQGNAIPQQALDEALSAHAVTEAQLQIAEAQVAGAEAGKAAAGADVEVAGAEVLVSQAEANRLRTLMEYASIKAPFDGVITARHVDHGTFVRSAAQGTAIPLLRIAKTDRIRIVLEVPEADALFVRVGTEVDVDVTALDENPFPGVVSRVAGALSPDTRTMRSEIDIDNADGRLRPGMYAKVMLKLETKTRAMVIPSKAIRVTDGDTIVLVVVDGSAKVKSIRVGYDDGIWAEIRSGLEEDDMVITATGGAIAPGASVAPVLSDS